MPIKNRTKYTDELFRVHTLRDLKFLENTPISKQVPKLKKLLRYEDSDIEDVEKMIPDAHSLYVEDVLKTDIYSSGIKNFDAMFSYKGILSGDIIEICGQSGVGKTIFIHTIFMNILKENKDIEAIYINAEDDYDPGKFAKLVNVLGISQELEDDIVSRFHTVNAKHMFDIVHALLMLYDQNGKCIKYPTEFDMSKIRFIAINTVTGPFFHLTPSLDASKKITLDLHKSIHRLSKCYGVTFFIGNLALHKYKISESDKGEDDASEDSRSIRESSQLDKVKAALDEYWPEILDHRFVMTNAIPTMDVVGNVEIIRYITLVESRNERSGEETKLKIGDVGIV